ncbi:hypothetical protein [Alishewanella phage vB_AspM_Slicko01]|nr:hypothetical protein [Alishewanella phage vB_AspM_Slicko01]
MLFTLIKVSTAHVLINYLAFHFGLEYILYCIYVGFIFLMIVSILNKGDANIEYPINNYISAVCLGFIVPLITLFFSVELAILYFVASALIATAVAQFTDNAKKNRNRRRK